jgi:hypothetical protein
MRVLFGVEYILIWTGYSSAFIHSTAQHNRAQYDTTRHDTTRRDTRQHFVSSSFPLHTFLPTTATIRVNEQQWQIAGMFSIAPSCHWNGRHAFSSLLQKRETYMFLLLQLLLCVAYDLYSAFANGQRCVNYPLNLADLSVFAWQWERDR